MPYPIQASTILSLNFTPTVISPHVHVFSRDYGCQEFRVGKLELEHPDKVSDIAEHDGMDSL